MSFVDFSYLTTESFFSPCYNAKERVDDSDSIASSSFTHATPGN